MESSSNHWQHFTTIGFPNKNIINGIISPTSGGQHFFAFQVEAWSAAVPAIGRGDPKRFFLKRWNSKSLEVYEYLGSAKSLETQKKHSHPISSLRGFVGHQFLMQVWQEPQSKQ